MPISAEAFFRQSMWATVRLIERCQSLSDEEWAARPIAAYGSIGETLVHLAATEQRYIHRLGGEPPGKRAFALWGTKLNRPVGIGPRPVPRSGWAAWGRNILSDFGADRGDAGRRRIRIR